VFLLSPKSCANPWSESGDQELDLGEFTRRLLFISSCPDLTNLTGTYDQSYWCKALVGFSSGELPGLCVFGLSCCWLVLCRFRGIWLGFV
jgi:hypothetical protein